MTRRERTLIFATVISALGAASLWGYAQLVDARDTAVAAAADRAECARLAPQILARRAGSAGPVIATREPRAEEVIRRIESAAKTAAFPEASIERIAPQPLRQADDSPYQEASTTVDLAGVTLRQLFTFLHVVGTEKPGLAMKNIHLSTSRNDDTSDRWSVETTLTYFVRSDASDGRVQGPIHGPGEDASEGENGGASRTSTSPPMLAAARRAFAGNKTSGESD